MPYAICSILLPTIRLTHIAKPIQEDSGKRIGGNGVSAWRLLWLIAVLVGCSHNLTAQNGAPTDRPLVLAHYMPWYVAKPYSQVWGWHWTMDHFDPEIVKDGRREAATQYYPLADCYDSGDPDVVDYHLQLMKLAGIEGVIVDWYGLTKHFDYAILHRNTSLLVDKLAEYDLKLVICYEDQTVAQLIKAGHLSETDAVPHVVNELKWVLENWASRQHYLRLDDRPAMLSFGHAGLTDEQWKQTISRLDVPIAYFSEHYRRNGAVGAFDWPIPTKGVAQVGQFAELSSQWPMSIPVAFPRFVDIYKRAKVNEGYPPIPDDSGKTFRVTFSKAVRSSAPMIQIATWNDWGEGTVIEPSIEFGYRDLELIQRWRRSVDPDTFVREPSDLRIPLRLLKLKQSRPNDSERHRRIDVNLAKGDMKLALRQITFLENEQTVPSE